MARDFLILIDMLATMLVSAGLLLTLLAFVLLYLRALPEQSSFIVKLVAVSLAGLLALTGTMGHLLIQPFIQNYHNANTDLVGKRLRFSPDGAGGYTINWVAYAFDPATGDPLTDEVNAAAIGFDFPFFDKSWSDLHVMRNSVVSFGRELRLQNSQFQYGSAPAIFALGLDLDPPAAGEEGGLFIQRSPGKTTVTWLNLPESEHPAHGNTFQLALYPSGVFDVSFAELSPPARFDIERPWQSYRLIGALPGRDYSRLAYFQLAQDLPLTIGPRGGVEDFHLEFRRTLHNFLRPYLARSQQAVESARTLLDTVLGNLDTLIYVSDMQSYEILYANRRIEEVFGFLHGRICWQVLQDNQTGVCAFCTNPLLLNRQNRPNQPVRWEQQNTRNGLWYSIIDSAIPWMDGRLARLSMAVDITQIKQAETRLLSQQRAIATLEERTQIGQELHDRLGQIFGFLSLQSQAAEALFEADKREAGLIALERVSDVAQDAHNQVREFILGMKEGAAGPQDLWESLRAYAVRLRHLYQMDVTLDLPDAPGRLLPPDKELHLLRIIQESLTNVRLHSGVNQAQVSFRQEGARWVVTIADAGRGFDTQTRPADPARPLSDLGQIGGLTGETAAHFGLSGMGERVRALGGTLRAIPSRGRAHASRSASPWIRTGRRRWPRPARSRICGCCWWTTSPSFWRG